MELTYTEKFYKELAKLPARTQQAIRDALIKLKVANSLETSGVDYAMLKGGGKRFKYCRIRVGDYRIGATYVNPNLMIIVVARRGDIYKTFPPK